MARPSRAAPLPTPSASVILSRRRFRAPDGRRLRLAFDGATGAVDAVEDAVCDGGPVEPVRGGRGGAAHLAAPQTPAGERGRQDHVIEAARRASQDVRHRSFTLLPSSYCNMACDYCGQTHRPGGWSMAERRAVVARVTAAAADPRCETVTVRWFGGEPLANYAGVVAVGAQIAAACRAAGKLLTGHMVTNGSLLTSDRLRTLVTRCGVTTYEITVDGPGVVHDARRLLKSGSGSYDRILSTVAAALVDDETGAARFSLRTNVDVRNAPYVDEYLMDLAARGLATDRVLVNLQPVHDWSNDTSAVRLPVEEFARLESGWMLRMAALGLRFGVLPVAPKRVVCAAVTRSAEILDPGGLVFSCSEHPLVGAQRPSALGRAVELGGGLRPPGQFDDFHDVLARGEVPCSSCAFLGVCGGSCPKVWREGGTPCPSFKFNMETRLEIWGALHGLRLEPDGGPDAR